MPHASPPTTAKMKPASGPHPPLFYRLRRIRRAGGRHAIAICSARGMVLYHGWRWPSDLQRIYPPWKFDAIMEMDRIRRQKWARHRPDLVALGFTACTRPRSSYPSYPTFFSPHWLWNGSEYVRHHNAPPLRVPYATED